MELPIHEHSDGCVPVFDCHVLIEGPDEAGALHGVVSNLPEITATARDERALLQKLVKEFKSTLHECQQADRPVPWQSIQPPAPGQRQRWIPVHL